MAALKFPELYQYPVAAFAPRIPLGVLLRDVGWLQVARWWLPDRLPGRARLLGTVDRFVFPFLIDRPVLAVEPGFDFIAQPCLPSFRQQAGNLVFCSAAIISVAQARVKPQWLDRAKATCFGAPHDAPS